MARTLIAICLLLLIVLSWTAIDLTENKIRLAGGPEGGTFLVYAEGLATLLRQKLPETKIKVEGSGGSVANLLGLEKGKVDLALVYAGDAYLGSLGTLKNQKSRYTKIRAIGRIYGSTAQLVVPKDSQIISAEGLSGRRVAIGSTGSGAAHSAERYFRILHIWDEITPLYMGYDLAMTELISGRAQAVWQLVGAPSRSIVQTNQKFPVRLVDLSELAEQSDFLLEYPFYTQANIAANTYAGQTLPIDSFQDNALLVTHPEVDPEIVSTILTLLFSEEGKQHMSQVHPVGRDLVLDHGLQGIQIPLHPEAKKFWKRKGLLK